MKALALFFTVGAIALSLPPLRVLIEQSMVWHMLVQMPLLVAAGAACSAVAGDRLTRWNRFGLTGFMMAQCITAYWMVPAMIDRAVVLPGADAGKLVTLWLAGAALRQGWVQSNLAVQLFFLGYGLPMMAWLGFFLASTDRRLCNAYSLESQLMAGQGLVALSIALGLWWAAWLLRQLMPSQAPVR